MMRSLPGSLPLFGLLLLLALGSEDIQQIIRLVVGLVGVYLLTGLINGGDEYVRHVLGQKFIYDLLGCGSTTICRGSPFHSSSSGKLAN